MTALLKVLKDCLLKTFNYQGREARGSYLVFLIFQLVWFSTYLAWFTGPHNEIGFFALIAFILPTFSCGVRRINDAGYSRGVIALLVIAPYLLFPFLLFPGSAKKTAEQQVD